jgi:hypothetical protein
MIKCEEDDEALNVLEPPADPRTARMMTTTYRNLTIAQSQLKYTAKTFSRENRIT